MSNLPPDEEQQPQRQFSVLGYTDTTTNVTTTSIMLASQKSDIEASVYPFPQSKSSSSSSPLEFYDKIDISSSNSNKKPMKNTKNDNECKKRMKTTKNDNELEFVNHFSSGVSSSSSNTIRFRNTKLRLYGDAENQFIIEERLVGEEDEETTVETSGQHNKRHVISVKHVTSSSFGLQFLRAAYTLVAFLVFGFLFVFCFQVVLFLFFNLAVDGSGGKGSAVVGALFSIPIFVYGMASIMVLGWLFVTETWKGHKLLLKIVSSSLLSATLVEWVSFFVFLGIPLLAVIVTLFQERENWWELSALVWVWCVFTFMATYVVIVVTSEIIAYFRVIRIHFNPNQEEEGEEVSPWKKVLNLVMKAVYLKQRHAYSGTRYEKYLVTEDDDELPPKEGYIFSNDHKPIQTKTSWYSKFTTLKFINNKMLYETLETPQRTYTLDEIQDIQAIVTKDNWSLETMFCSNKKGKIVGGKNHGLTLEQIRSSVACQLIGSFLIFLLIIALLTWMQSANIGSIFLVLLLSLLICFWPIARSLVPLLYSLRPTEEDEEDINNSGNDNVDASSFQVWELVRITQPRKELAYGLFLIEVFFFFLWPLISLIVTKNYPILVTFFFLGTVSFLRLHFNIASVLADLGSINDVSLHLHPENKLFPTASRAIKQEESEEHHILNEKSRLADIIKKTRGENVQLWIYGYGIAFLMILLVSLKGHNSVTDGGDGSQYNTKGVTFVSGFSYPPRTSITTDATGNLPYQTCKLEKGFGIPNTPVESVQLQDFAFMATSAYMGPDEAQPVLDAYFGKGKVKDEYEFVNRYRKETDSEKGVSYKLFSFVDYPGYAVMSIRGSETLVDWIVNIQLWSCAVLAQVVRFVMPLGNLWTPIYYKLVYLANSVQSNNLRKVSYYRATAKFVNDVQAGWGNNPFTTLRVTGVSLGGGIAIITGAQTGASTVAISGPNAMMSRATFDPPLTVEQLNTRVINVIPDRDLIASIDDPGNLYQRIECRAPAWSLFGCHSMYRSLCEYAYQCGSDGRPVLCWCVSKYGYPIPDQIGSVSWEESCKDA